MLENLLLLIIEAVLGFFSLLLIARFYMQLARVSFRNQIGQLVIALTDWAVGPVRRVLPGLRGLDLATLVLAWVTQSLIVLAEFWLRGFPLGAATLLILGLGALETVRMFVYLLIGVVLIAALMSWVNPGTPYAPLLNGLARPLLRPIQRFVPPVANFDLSPLVLLLLLQVVLLLLSHLRGSLVALIA